MKNLSRTGWGTNATKESMDTFVVGCFGIGLLPPMAGWNVHCSFVTAPRKKQVPHRTPFHHHHHDPTAATQLSVQLHFLAGAAFSQSGGPADLPWGSRAESRSCILQQHRHTCRSLFELRLSFLVCVCRGWTEGLKSRTSDFSFPCGGGGRKPGIAHPRQEGRI